MILIFKLQVLEILENEGFKYTKDSGQLENNLDAKERDLKLTPHGLHVADTFYGQNRSNRKNRC